MKKFITVLFLMVFFGQINAQYLVIDNSGSGGNYIPIQDTVLSSVDPILGLCSSFNYHFDLDQDSIPDINFYLECYIGGLGSYYKIVVTSFNDFSILMDTNYTEHFQFLDSLRQVHDTTRKTPVVRKYNWGDTIFNNQDLLNTEGKLLNYSTGNYPPCIYSNVNLFFDDTSYIAFEKSNGDLYYLKVYVPCRTTLELIYAKTNARINDINEHKISGNFIFPNPAKKIISFNKGFDLIQIFNIQGILLVDKNLSGTQNTFDISHLNKGIYIVNLKKGNNVYTSKLLKR